MARLNVVSESVSIKPPVAEDQLPKMKPNAQFRFIYHPDRWDFHSARQRWFPCLGQQAIDPGVGGVTASGEFADATNDLLATKWIVLPVDTREYLVKVRVAGGHHHMTKWQSVTVSGGRGHAKLTDPDGYFAWIDSLIERGFIPAAPDQDGQELVLAKSTDLATRVAERATEMPTAKHLANKLQGQVDSITAAMEQAENKIVAEPTKSGDEQGRHP